MENPVNWYDTTPYDEIKRIIRDRMSVMAREYVGIGFYLRRVKDNEMYLEDGYKDVHEFAMAEFGMSRATVNHCIRINEQFSVGGNSPVIDNQFKDFSKSQLQEMLYLPEDKREEVTPDMTVKEIRSMKEVPLDVEPEVVDEQIPGQMNIYDYPEAVPEEMKEDAAKGQQEEQPESSVPIVKPNKDEQLILDDFAKLLIRNKKDYFLGDFHARVLNVSTSGDLLKNKFGKHPRYWTFRSDDNIYHINLFDDYIQLWQDYPSFCIGNFDWFYLMAAVQSQWNVVALEDAKQEAEDQWKKENGKDVMMCLAKVIVGNYDIDELLTDPLDLGIFHNRLLEMLSYECTYFEFRDKKLVAGFYSNDISITDASTYKEAGNYTSEELFEELDRLLLDKVDDTDWSDDADEAEGVHPDEDEEWQQDIDVEVTVQAVLDEEKEKLDQYLEVYKEEKGLPVFIKKQKIIVAALDRMARSLEEK